MPQDYKPIFTKKQKELEIRNKKLIDDYMRLPFWKKWFRHESLRQEVIRSWQMFNLLDR